MKQMVCSVCSYTYDEAKGIPEAGIAPGTRWEDLPEGWRCPWCGASKDMFREKAAAPVPAPDLPPPAQEPGGEWQLSALELSVICSNLARGCEKQYLPEQEKGFRELAEFFRARSVPAPDAGTQALLQLVERDLSSGLPYAHTAAGEAADRGALRALTWSEKVTRMLQNLLSRYEKGRPCWSIPAFTCVRFAALSMWGMRRRRSAPCARCRAGNLNRQGRGHNHGRTVCGAESPPLHEGLSLSLCVPDRGDRYGGQHH